jgi:myosin heavy subunit
MYDKLFVHIIAIINKNNESQIQSDRCIGLLDIFGFEIFEINSFEQLCINYCNEMLQNLFNFVIFSTEKELYMTEGIFCESIEFIDNKPMITNIETVFKALDEEAKIPRGIYLSI